MRKRELATAISFSLVGSLAAVPALAQDQDEDTAELDRLEVTGSRIKRADIESASPVRRRSPPGSDHRGRRPEYAGEQRR